MAFSSKKITIILLVPFLSLYAFKLPSGERFSRWNQLLELKLYDVVVTATELDFARNVYKSDTSTRVNEINGDEILKSVLRKLGNLTSSRKSALKRLVDNAEENFANFQKSNASIPNLEALSFFNVKAVEIPKTMKMAYSPHFQQVVSFDQSGVHIPLEIYDGYSQILNGLKWTTSLDEVFKENRRRDPHLKWQYFGSFFGFLRVYPAFKWPDHPSLPDLFDVRRRSWYIQSSVTPKDVIILIDRSGSVHGPTLDIMKITARALLNTLGENDYVNVAWFNNKVKWVVPCLNTLMQATAQMRRLLGDAVERLTESNLTSYTTALDFAFEEFRKFDELKKPWVGSNCHKIVMFLSDGGTEWPTDLINRHCNESRNGKIKIFTFACGPHPIPTVVLKEMACSTGGYFSPVTALGSVRVKIRDYVRVLSRPLAYSNDKDMFTWHNFYRDIGGLGMVTTVTLPVFNKLPNPSGKIVNLLGIMGVDVSVEEMTNLFPQHLMGPFGYAFSINTNGFVVFHPRLQDHIVYLEDPPNIYLTDLEGSTEEIKTMEKQIIDGTNGSLRNFRSIVPVGMGHAILVELDYFYGAIESTTFRFGIALPSNHKVLKIENLDVNEYLSYLTSLKGVLLAPWKFCGETDEDLNLGKLVQRIKQHDNSCHEELINHLLWDSKMAFQLERRWNETYKSLQSKRSGEYSTFLITNGGLTISYSTNEAEEYVRQTDPLKNSLYKRASSSPGFVFSPSKEKRNRVTTAARISLNDSYVAAVIGAEIDQQVIQRVFEEVIGSDSDENCASSQFLHCYLFNDGGIITASNVRSSKSGDFIGVHDPEILQVLLSEGIFRREFKYNYQSWCSREPQRIHGRASSQHKSLFKLTYEAVAAFQWTFFYTSLLHLISSILAWKRVDHAEHILENTKYSCVTRSAWYYHTFSAEHTLPREASLICKTKTRNMRISFMPKLQLFFIVSQPPCYDSPTSHAIMLNEDEDVEFHHCQTEQHYRLRPPKCYSQIPRGISSDCMATSNASTMKGKPFTQLLLIVVHTIRIFVEHFLKISWQKQVQFSG